MLQQFFYIHPQKDDLLLKNIINVLLFLLMKDKLLDRKYFDKRRLEFLLIFHFLLVFESF